MGNMKSNRKFRMENDEAVSAVIGVILMVAITVAIAATVYVYVSGMLGGGPSSTPSVSMTASPSGTNATVTVASVTQSGIPWTDVTVVFHCITNATQMDDDVTSPVGDTIVSGGDLLAFTGLTDNYNYRVTMVYDNTGSTMGTCSWTQ
jgi:flagellin-like protein